MKTKRKPTPEKDVVGAILTAFRDDPDYLFFRRNVGSMTKQYNGKNHFVRFSEPGQSDLWGIARKVICPSCGAVTGIGVHIEIECKNEIGKLSDAQSEWIERVEKYGGIALTIRPNEKGAFAVWGQPFVGG